MNSIFNLNSKSRCLNNKNEYRHKCLIKCCKCVLLSLYQY